MAKPTQEELDTVPPFYLGSQRLELIDVDPRRYIFEINVGDASIQGFRVRETGPLGNHSHRRKTEHFWIVSGKGVLGTMELYPSGTPKTEAQVKPLEPGVSIIMQPNTVHVFFFEPGAEMICRSSERFNPEDKDMHPYTLYSEPPTVNA